jgi:tyrosinase
MSSGPLRRVRRPRAALMALAVMSALVAMTVVACTVAPTSSQPSASSSAPLVVERKNVKDLTSEEKADFVAAIKKLKEVPAPNDSQVLNWYDHFVRTHVEKLVCWTAPPAQGGYGHFGPTLLTWHRAFLLEFEQALSTVAGKPMAIPYWDWTDEDSTAAVFAEDFMGPVGDPDEDYAVTRGPFREGEWTIDVKGFTSTNPGQFDHLVRATGKFPGVSALPTTQDVTQALLRPRYEASPWNSAADPDVSFRQYLDGNDATGGLKCGDDGLVSPDGMVPGSVRLHGQVHVYVGGLDAQGQPGSMADCVASPNDPIFWLHHANLDRIAEAWWGSHDYEYLPVTGGPNGDNLDDALFPYSLTNRDVASPSESLGYVYSSLPSTSGQDVLQDVPAPNPGASGMSGHH